MVGVACSDVGLGRTRVSRKWEEWAAVGGGEGSGAIATWVAPCRVEAACASKPAGSSCDGGSDGGDVR